MFFLEVVKRASHASARKITSHEKTRHAERRDCSREPIFARDRVRPLYYPQEK